MGSGETVTESSFSRQQIDTAEWLPIVSDGSIRIYSRNRNYVAVIQSPRNDQIEKIDAKFQSFQELGNLLVTQRSDTREWLFFNRLTKKKLPLKDVVSFRDNGQNQFAISTRSNHHGLLDVNGNLLIDTIYQSISLNQYSTKIWAHKIVNNRNVSFLLDSTGKQVFTDHFDISFELNSGDKLVSQNQKKGIIDSKTLQWKIRPSHLCLIKLFDDYYYAGNELNKKGIIRSSGEVIIPIIYDTIILLYTNCQVNGQCPSENRTIQWIVRKGNAEYLADHNGRIINSKAAIRSLKSDLFFGDNASFDGYRQYRRFPQLDYSPSLHFLRGLTMKEIQSKRKALWTNSVLKNEVLDTINRMWSIQKSNCNRGNNNWGISINGGQEQPKPLIEQALQSCNCLQSNPYYYGVNSLMYQLKSIGKKFVTLDISYQNQNNNWDPMRGQAPPSIPNNTHINIIDEKGKARYITLKEIFPDDDILMQEFILSLQKRDDLKLECSSLENMLEMINGSFSLSDEGVHLYLNSQVYYSNTQVELLIPVENLEKIASSKWIVPFIKD